MSLLTKSLYFWRSALRGFRRTPFVHCLAVAAIAISLFLAGLARGTVEVVDSLLAAASTEIALTIYLKENAQPSQAEEIARDLAVEAGATAQVVVPDAALKRLRTELGELGDVLRDLPKNPLPLSIELRVAAPSRSPGKLRAVAEKARSLPLAGAVDYPEEAVRQLSAIASAVRYVAMVALLVAVVATLVIVGTALQLAIHSRREEIEIQKLVGATDPFVGAPFVVEGLIQGLAGALIAIVGLRLFSMLFGSKLLSLFAFLSHPALSVSLPTSLLSAQLAMFGCLLGLVGSFAAVRRVSQV